VNHGEDPQPYAETEELVAFLVLRMVGIREKQGVLVGENGLGFPEGSAVLPPVGGGFCGIQTNRKSLMCLTYRRCNYMSTNRFGRLTTRLSCGQAA
jgi:hypothetical protein